MSVRTSSAAEFIDGQRDFRALMMYHPTIHVTDLDEAEAFFVRVFGRSSTPMASVMKVPPTPGHATDYSTFTAISDVLIDSFDPKRYINGGVQKYPTVEQSHLKTFGWHVDGIAELYRELRRQGFGVLSTRGELAEGDDPPMAGPLPAFNADAADAGLGYQFFPMFPFPADPRHEPGWTIPPVTDNDPLGIEYCSHHTVLTENPDRAVALVADLLGGTVIHDGLEDVRGVGGPYVRLADAVIHYAVPDEEAPAADDFSVNGPADVYHAITWKVVDLDRVAHHLQANGVRVQSRSEQTIITDPQTSLGVPWGFTVASIPGDRRKGSLG